MHVRHKKLAKPTLAVRSTVCSARAAAAQSPAMRRAPLSLLQSSAVLLALYPWENQGGQKPITAQQNPQFWDKILRLRELRGRTQPLGQYRLGKFRRISVFAETLRRTFSARPFRLGYLPSL